MSPTPRSKPLTEPIRVRSVAPYALPTAEEYADRFNNYGGGVNPLGYMGHEFAADGSYGYRPRAYPKRPLVSSRKPPLPPQPRPASFDFGMDDEDALSMPVPETSRRGIARAQVEHHQDDESTHTGCLLWSSATPSLSSPWITIVRSPVLNKYVFFVWHIALLSYSLAGLIVVTVYGFSRHSLIVCGAFCTVFARELVLVIGIVVFTCQKYPEWRERIIRLVGITTQAAANVTFSVPVILAINYPNGSSLRNELVTYMKSTPSIYLALALCSLYLLDFVFTGLPPSLGGFVLGAGLTFMIGFPGLPPGDYNLPSFFLLILASVGVSVVAGCLMKFLILSFHEPRLLRMMAASSPADVTSDGNRV